MFNLSTKRLTLRPLVLQDAADFFEYRSNREANPFQGWIPEKLQDAKDFIQYRTNPILNIPDTWTQLAVIHHHTQDLIGDIGIYFMPDKHHEVKLGYTLSVDHQGKGYATEAIEALIGYLHQYLGKSRFIALIAPENLSSIRLVKRLGFIQVDIEKEAELQEEEYPEDLLYILEI
ncbi:MAG: GNAT family N-acetyltransferase [Candidatus Marinimicrobia bacterium]|nr:GNAT family N-acetyltransferase [Candidatus Neomarinimicrobiota bacterium]